MEVNQDLTIPEEDVLNSMEDQIEIQEMIEAVEKDTMTRAVKIVTAAVADGNNCKT